MFNGDFRYVEIIYDIAWEVYYKLRRDLIYVYEYDLSKYELSSFDSCDISLILVDDLKKMRAYLNIVRYAFKMSIFYYLAISMDVLWEMLFDTNIKNYLLVNNLKEVIGTVSLGKTTHRNCKESCVLSNFALSKEFIGKKLSYNAMHSVLNFAKVCGYKYIRLKVKKVNVPALKVYSALGFIEMEDI